MRHDRLRALPNAGEPSVGTDLLSRWPALVASAALTGDTRDSLTGEARP
jgi:hypothetical protein